MHPMNWLPPELLSQIFAAVIDADSEGHPPVVLSHVSPKWRELVLSDPYLWSHISLRGFRDSQTIDVFLSRSKDVHLKVNYVPLSDSMATEECIQVHCFLNRISPHFYRCKEFSFQCRSAASIALLLPYFKKFHTFFPNLQHLNLSISTPNPSFFEVPDLLLQRGDAGGQESFTLPSHGICLRHLILNQLPACGLPTEFICNVRKLHLSYSTGKQIPFRHYYHFKLSSLYSLLSLTPRLEELILNNTVPYVDALPAPSQIAALNPSTPSPFQYLSPIRLEHLRSIEWTYPCSSDVPRLLCLFEAPILDKLDLWVEKPPPRRSNHRPSAVLEHVHFNPSFPMLRDLSFQCNGDDAMVSVLRQFSLPAIERVAFTNVDTAARKQEDGADPKLIVFPRLENIFHDPRLPHLTHLTLSHFKIPPEAGRGEALFGYMPLLTSLSLDSCLGVGRLLEGLQEKLLVGTMNNSTDPNRSARPSKRVKLCPRLEALSIWGCGDVDFGSLRAVVLARNGASTQVDGADTETNCSLHGTISGNVMGHDVQQGLCQEGSQGGNPDSRALTERRIKPLNSKHPILRAATMTSSSSQSDPKAKIVSTLVAMREVLEPANIIYIRVVQCKLVTEEQALSLRDLGVIDVIWGSLD